MPAWNPSSCTSWISRGCDVLVKLIVHIGHGKTGSSSIQQCLSDARSILDKQGVKYLGLMLEHADTEQKRDWQRNSGSDIFFYKTSTEAAVEDVYQILCQELQQLSDRGFQKVIWSNEWILQRPGRVLPALQKIVLSGFDVEVQAFVRRHDKWVTSAYTQWGLRDKTYTGPLLSFEGWFARSDKSNTEFARYIEPWDQAFPGRFRLMNFDAAGDAVQHFMEVNGIEGMPTVNDNASPSVELLALQAVFNSRKRGPIPPQAFEAVLKFSDRSDENRSVIPTLDQLMPSAVLLKALVEERAEDIARIDALLAKSGEPPLSFEDDPKQVRHPSPWEIDQRILKLVYALIEETGQLRSQIVGLRAQLSALVNGEAK